MAERKERARLAILVKETIEPMCGDRYYHLRGIVRQYRPREHGAVNGWSYPDDSYSPVNGWPDLGITIACQGDERSRKQVDGQQVYGWDITYRELHGVDLRKINKYQETLKRIDKGLTKLQETRGCARTFGEYVGRVAEVLGADTILIEPLPRPGHDNGQRSNDLGSGISMIDHLIYRWVHADDEQQKASA